MSVLYFIYLVFLIYLAVSVFYLAVFAIAGRLGRADDTYPSSQPPRFRKIGVLIPAYKEDAVIIDSVNANLKQQYPAHAFDLIVIADSFQPQTLAKLATMPVRVIEVSFEVSTVAKAINTALSKISDDEYEILVVSDADNHMAADFLSRINTAFDQNWKAVQGHRVAKNTNTSVAVLDAISEEINNHIFRKGSRALGLSSSIIGSGMAFDPVLMKKGMSNLHTMGGYDKELEMNIVLAGYKIAYLENAFVYDEKVAQQAVFENQRTRWIAAQWQFLKFYFRRGVTELMNGRMASAFKVIQALVLPRVLLLGVLFVCTLLGFLSPIATLWLIPLLSLTALCISLALSVPGYLWRQIGMRELMLVPVLMLRFARAIFNMRKAFKSFLPTPHTSSAEQQKDKMKLS
ncbi:glycosyltransferase family 2 protein [Spirosoma terrae]|uniref:Glycosyltransferase family 2 protein n=1 Tax=Spirosoma terrae TaxID=1968276 RepID=A0A6L9LFK9_9BACT|nr:glycosyltransferase family 2 protein [Spirosoma terrae]NDU98467.1 glycosyltransferase family 2 protein [Spirosoma terrae]